jgi:hypothetical protein
MSCCMYVDSSTMGGVQQTIGGAAAHEALLHTWYLQGLELGAVGGGGNRWQG